MKGLSSVKVKMTKTAGGRKLNIATRGRAGQVLALTSSSCRLSLATGSINVMSVSMSWFAIGGAVIVCVIAIVLYYVLSGRD